MIRFILQTSYRYEASGMEGQDFHTLDLEVPELEKQLTSGGFGETGYQRTELRGAEVIRSDSSGLLEAAEAAMRISSLWLPAPSVLPEHDSEANALKAMAELLQAAIAKAKETA